MRKLLLVLACMMFLSGCYVGVRSPVVVGPLDEPYAVGPPPVVVGPPLIYPYGYWGGGFYRGRYLGPGYYHGSRYYGHGPRYGRGWRG
jgi:hypothetical protein